MSDNTPPQLATDELRTELRRLCEQHFKTSGFLLRPEIASTRRVYMQAVNAWENTHPTDTTTVEWGGGDSVICHWDNGQARGADHVPLSPEFASALVRELKHAAQAQEMLTPEQRDVAQRIHALCVMGSGRDRVHFSWGDSAFAKPYELAVAQAGHTSHIGVEVSWGGGATLSVVRSGGSGTAFAHVPLEGELLAEFTAVLQGLANRRVAQQLEVERQRALALAAAERVQAMLSETAKADPWCNTTRTGP